MFVIYVSVTLTQSRIRRNAEIRIKHELRKFILKKELSIYIDINRLNKYGNRRSVSNWIKLDN